MILCMSSGFALANRAKARALTSEGQNFVDAGRVELALSRFEEAMKSDPDYLASYELAIPIWMRLGRLGVARTKLETLTLRCTDCAFAWYALGAIYRKSGRFDLAVLSYEIYLRLRPSEPDAYFGLAMALGALKDPRASSVLRRYLALETRANRAAYRKQASRLLGALEKRDESLEDDGSMLPRRPESDTVIRLRREANKADASGQWFVATGYRALLWLWR